MIQRRNLAKVAEAERLALSAIANHPRLAEEEGIDEGAFLSVENKKTLIAIFKSSRDGALDVGSLRILLGAEGADSLLSLSVYSEEQARTWVRRMVDYSTAARLDESIHEAWSSNYGDSPSGERIERIRRILRDSEPQVASNEVPTLAEVTNEFLESARREIESGRPAAIVVGIPAIDRNCKGLRSGELTLVAAEGGAGKSTFLSVVLRKAAAQGARTYLASAEMAQSQLGEREGQSLIGKDPSTFWTSLDDVDRAQRVLAMERETLERISIDTTWSITPAGLEARVRRVANSRGVDLLAVDHIDHIQIGSMEGAERLSAAVLCMKGLAKALAIPVLLVSHINRYGEREGGGDATPNKSWLRGSTHLGQVPDNIIFLTRKFADNKTTLWVEKARQTGMTGRYDLVYNTNFGTYSEG